MCLKNIADGATRVMLGIEIVDAKERMADMRYEESYGRAASTTMRLIEPWRDSWRIIYADSWFAMRPIDVCRGIERLGLRSCLNVKNGAHGVTCMPKEFVDNALRRCKQCEACTQEPPDVTKCEKFSAANWHKPRGKWAGVRDTTFTASAVVTDKQCNGKEFHIGTIGWLHKHPATLIGTAWGGDLEETDERFFLVDVGGGHMVRERAINARPAAHVRYSAAANAIDTHNHLHYGGKGNGGEPWSATWKTETWQCRFMQSLFDASLVNAFLSYSHWSGGYERDARHKYSFKYNPRRLDGTPGVLDHWDFRYAVATSLATGGPRRDTDSLRTGTGTNTAPTQASGARSGGAAGGRCGSLVPLTSIGRNKKKHDRIKCIYCKERTQYVCANEACNEVRPVGLCLPKHGQLCHLRHRDREPVPGHGMRVPRGDEPPEFQPVGKPLGKRRRQNGN